MVGQVLNYPRYLLPYRIHLLLFDIEVDNEDVAGSEVCDLPSCFELEGGVARQKLIGQFLRVDMLSVVSWQRGHRPTNTTFDRFLIVIDLTVVIEHRLALTSYRHVLQLRQIHLLPWRVVQSCRNHTTTLQHLRTRSRVVDKSHRLTPIFLRHLPKPILIIQMDPSTLNTYISKKSTVRNQRLHTVTVPPLLTSPELPIHRLLSVDWRQLTRF